MEHKDWSLPDSDEGLGRGFIPELPVWRVCAPCLDAWHRISRCSIAAPAFRTAYSSEAANYFRLTLRAMAENDAERFVLRALVASDIHKGFMQLLGQLTVAGDVSEEQFAQRVQYLQRLGDDHYVAVIEDMEKSRIVATGSILIEHKFVRNCGKAGHIEDVVVDQSVRGQRLGQRIIEFLTKFAKDKGCYKVILDCTVANSSFYEKCGYKKKEIQMAAYF